MKRDNPKGNRSSLDRARLYRGLFRPIPSYCLVSSSAFPSAIFCFCYSSAWSGGVRGSVAGVGVEDVVKEMVNHARINKH